MAQSDLAVTLSWEAPGQVAVEKTYRFRRGRYDIGLEYRIRNLGTAPYSAASYLQIQRAHSPPERSYFNVDSYSFTGPMTYDGKKYEKLTVDEADRGTVPPEAREGLDRLHPASLPGRGRAAGGPGIRLRRERWIRAFTP